jgi:hypothetical protein
MLCFGLVLDIFYDFFGLCYDIDAFMTVLEFL